MIDIYRKKIHNFKKAFSNLLINYKFLYIRYARH